ncbi:MAG: hypothetical protein PPP55_03080 [Halorubrum sp.]
MARAAATEGTVALVTNTGGRLVGVVAGTNEAAALVASGVGGVSPSPYCGESTLRDDADSARRRPTA